MPSVFGWQQQRHDGCSGAAAGFAHDVSDVRFHGGFSDAEIRGDLLVGPSRRHAFDDHLFAVGELEPFLDVAARRGGPVDRFEQQKHPDPASRLSGWQAEPPNQNAIA